MQGATFGDRIKQSQEGHLQRGHFNGVLGGGAKQQSHRKFEKQKIKASGGMPTAKFKRENKNRPAEQSSKRPVPRFRDIIETSHRHDLSVDHSFDSLYIAIFVQWHIRFAKYSHPICSAQRFLFIQIKSH